MEPADDILRQHETCYAYNNTFNYYYKQSMPRQQCQEFVDRRNECKGGQWEVRRKIDCQDHYDCLKHKKCAGDGSDAKGSEMQ